MAAENRYTLHSLKIGSTYIPITEGSADPSVNLAVEKAGASSSPTFVGVQSIQPVITGTTPDIAALLTAIPITGVALTTVEVWFAQRGDLAVGSTGIKAAGTDGIGIIETLSASSGGKASGTFRLVLAGTDSTAPLAFTSAALPTPTTLTNVYTLGPVTIGATTYHTTDLSISPNCSVKNDTVAGQPWPTYTCITEVSPTAQVTLADNGPASVLDAVGGSVDDAEFFFKKMAADDTVRETTGVSIVFPKSHAYISGTGGSSGDDANLQVTFQAVIDGAENIATVNTSKTVTAIGTAE